MGGMYRPATAPGGYHVTAGEIHTYEGEDINELMEPFVRMAPEGVRFRWTYHYELEKIVMDFIYPDDSRKSWTINPLEAKDEHFITKVMLTV